MSRSAIVPDLSTAEQYFDVPLDLALVDLNLRDGCTGPEIGERLGAKGVTVIFVTANPGLLSGNVAGAIGVITKPTDEKIVKAAVNYALGRRTGTAVSPPREPAPVRLISAPARCCGTATLDDSVRRDAIRARSSRQAAGRC